MVLFASQYYMMVKIVFIEEWSPALTVNSVVLSILSMLSSATKKVKPFNDA